VSSLGGETGDRLVSGLVGGAGCRSIGEASITVRTVAGWERKLLTLTIHNTNGAASGRGARTGTCRRKGGDRVDSSRSGARASSDPRNGRGAGGDSSSDVGEFLLTVTLAAEAVAELLLPIAVEVVRGYDKSVKCF
jgi:hypothetical protein